jgi:hypothetical protein
MPNVHGIEFDASQAELVKDLVRELLKDGDCVVYPVHNMQPKGELRMAATPPGTTQRKLGGVFFRVRPGTQEALIVRPMNAKAGQKFTKVDRASQVATLALIRTWRWQTGSLPVRPRETTGRPQLVITAGKKKNHHGQ